jgi:hypothetical protein
MLSNKTKINFGKSDSAISIKGNFSLKFQGETLLEVFEYVRCCKNI